MTMASVPVPVAPGPPVQVGTDSASKVAALLSVATCTAPTIAGIAKRAFVMRMMLIVPGEDSASRSAAPFGSPALTAFDTPTVKNPSTQISADSSRRVMRSFSDTAVIKATHGLSIPNWAANRPKYRLGSPQTRLELDAERTMGRAGTWWFKIYCARTSPPPRGADESIVIRLPKSIISVFRRTENLVSSEAGRRPLTLGPSAAGEALRSDDDSAQAFSRQLESC